MTYFWMHTLDVWSAVYFKHYSYVNVIALSHKLRKLSNVLHHSFQLDLACSYCNKFDLFKYVLLYLFHMFPLFIYFDVVKKVV